jgi:hypothetical protein
MSGADGNLARGCNGWIDTSRGATIFRRRYRRLVLERRRKLDGELCLEYPRQPHALSDRYCDKEQGKTDPASGN